METLAKLIAGVRTPLALAGVVLFILYGIVTKILQLKIFTPFTSDQTAQVITLIIQWAFWLAVLAICLGALGWLLQLSPRFRPNLTVNSLDVIPADSPGKKITRG